MKVNFLLLLLLATICSSCWDKEPAPTPAKPEVTQPTATPIPTPKPELKLGKKYRLWSTFYKTPALYSAKEEKFCLKDMTGKCVSGNIKHDQKCFIQMQGSGIIDGVLFVYEGASSRGIPASDSCSRYGSTWNGSGNVRFKPSTEFKYGKGSFNNPLIPYVSIACPKEFPNNMKFYIPDAKGIKLPDGSVHDGIFICHDRGGAIKGDHIDTFIGIVDYSTNWKMKDWARGGAQNPFTHVKSSASFKFDAYHVLE